MATITVAIPLHRSAEWVDNIVDNIARLPPQVTEIIVSDRTCVDGTAHVLRKRLIDDHRVVVIADSSGLTWEQHYQTLLEQADGELFMWMPHDDIFEANWIPALEETLDSYPDAWLAFGRLERVEYDGHTPRTDWLPGPYPVGQIPGTHAFGPALRGQLGVPFRGLFRRAEVLDAGIRLEPVGRYPGSDAMWVLAVALRSALAYDDRSATQKRIYPTSTHAQWAARPVQRIRSVFSVVNTYGPKGFALVVLRTRIVMSFAQGAARRGRALFAHGPDWRRR